VPDCIAAPIGPPVHLKRAEDRPSRPRPIARRSCAVRQRVRPATSALLAGTIGVLASYRSVPQLSDGTRDQLYFALRLAAIEEALGRNGPMPVVLDGVLVNFDDNRARAALRCIAALAESSQVLFFTHHSHVLSLAEEVLAPEQLTVHELAPAASGQTG